MNWLNKVRSRLKDDRADAILVMSVILVPFFFICAGFAMDLTKAVWVKQQYQIMGQEATTAAARNIWPSGAIKESAVQTVVSVYNERFNGDGRFAETQDGALGVRNSSCTTVTLPNGDVKTAPYMDIVLSGGRNNSGVTKIHYVSEGGAPATSVSVPSGYNQSERYYAISATIYDTAPNLILGMFGKPCQQLKSEVSSITFGSQEDVYDWDTSAGGPGSGDDGDPGDPGGPGDGDGDDDGGGPGDPGDPGTGTVNCTVTDGTVLGQVNQAIATNIVGSVNLGNSTDSIKDVVLTSNGGATASVSGTTITAKAGADGNYKMGYKVTTTKGATCSGFLTLKISTAVTCATTPSGLSGYVNLPMSKDVSGSVTMSSSTDSIANVVVTNNGGATTSVSGTTITAKAGSNGNYTIAYKVTTAKGASCNGTLTLQITSPTCAAGNGTATGYANVTLTRNVAPLVTMSESSDSISNVAITNNGGIGATVSGGTTVRGSSATAGVYNVTYKVTTAKGANCSGTVKFTVVAPAKCPSGLSANVTYTTTNSSSGILNKDVTAKVVYSWTPYNGPGTTVAATSTNSGNGGTTLTESGSLAAGSLTMSKTVTTFLGLNPWTLSGWNHSLKVTDSLGGSVTCSA